MNSLQIFATVPNKLGRLARKSPADRWLAIRETVKATVQTIHRRVARAQRRALARLNEPAYRRRIFCAAYANGAWGKEAQAEFFSGVGSRGESAEIYVSSMAQLLARHAAELGLAPTVVDLGCGDFHIGRALMARVSDFTYIGCDIVPELIAHHARVYANARISFRQLDIVADPLPHGDVCLVRQVLQHLSNTEIMRFVQKADYQYLYVTEGQPPLREGPVNPDKVAGPDVRFDWYIGRGRGVELDQPPYRLTLAEMFRTSERPNEIIVTWRVWNSGSTPCRA